MNTQPIEETKVNEQSKEMEFTLEDKVVSIASPLLMKKRRKNNLVLCVHCLNSFEGKIFDSHLVICKKEKKNQISSHADKCSDLQSKHKRHMQLLSMNHKDLVDLVFTEMKIKMSNPRAL